MRPENTPPRDDTYSGDALEAIATRLYGELVQPGHAPFDDARAVWNAAFDRRPALIVRAACVGDVQVAVDFARAHDMPVAVRSGGHSFAGHGSGDGVLLIDLSALRAMSIDPDRQVARIEPGLTWGEVAEAAHAHGLALTSGDMASVGVGGLTLGGGIGWMARKHGLTIDNLRAVELVTADGRLLRASADEHAQLFWGLRGGGGNLGVATAFEFDVHPAGLVLGGAVIYDAADAARVLPAYARLAAAAPDELTTMATIMPAPPVPFIPPAVQGRPVVVVMVCHAGGPDEGQRVVAPLRALAQPVADVIGPMPYPALLAMTAAGAVRGYRHDLRSMFLERLDEDALQTIIAQAAQLASPGAMAQLRVLGGAMSRVAPDATAFAHRDKAAMFTVTDHWLDAGDDAAHQAALEGFWRAIQPYASGVYVNFLADEGDERIRSAYPPATYARLATLKKHYDPTNLFSLNQNVKPTTSSAEQDETDERAA